MSQPRQSVSLSAGEDSTPRIHYAISQKKNSQEVTVKIYTLGFVARDFRVAMVEDNPNTPQIKLQFLESLNPSWSSVPATTDPSVPPESPESESLSSSDSMSSSESSSSPTVSMPYLSQGTVTIKSVWPGRRIIFIQAIPATGLAPITEIAHFTVRWAFLYSWEAYLILSVSIIVFVALVALGFWGATRVNDANQKVAAYVCAILGAFPPFVLLEAVPIVLGFSSGGSA